MAGVTDYDIRKIEVEVNPDNGTMRVTTQVASPSMGPIVDVFVSTLAAGPQDPNSEVKNQLTGGGYDTTGLP